MGKDLGRYIRPVKIVLIFFIFSGYSLHTPVLDVTSLHTLLFSMLSLL